jgi:pyruvate/2-oxoglutarate dehydrogenase complex dihydrolipoamide dehydrogenase (E3) component
MFTHTAWDDGRILVANFTGGDRTTDRVVPYAIFTDPQLGRVGLSEEESTARGLPHKVLRFPMRRNAAAQEDRATDGFVKMIVGEDDRLLGATIVAEHASELIQVPNLLLASGMGLDALRDGLVVHPTYMESVQNVLLD